jgi:hypothetical protein
VAPTDGGNFNIIFFVQNMMSISLAGESNTNHFSIVEELGNHPGLKLEVLNLLLIKEQ